MKVTGQIHLGSSQYAKTHSYEIQKRQLPFFCLPASLDLQWYLCLSSSIGMPLQNIRNKGFTEAEAGLDFA